MKFRTLQFSFWNTLQIHMLFLNEMLGNLLMLAVGKLFFLVISVKKHGSFPANPLIIFYKFK